MKFLYTYTLIGGEKLQALKEMGYRGSHGQFRVVCKCKSVADANKKCEEAGLGRNTYKRGKYGETGSDYEIQLLETTDIIVCLQ